MSKILAEEKVLKKLDIEDFRHLTKDKVITMASMLDKMDPEVAKKSLELFPEFNSSIISKLSEFKDTINLMVDTSKEEDKFFYDQTTSIMNSLQTILEDKNLCFENRKYVMDKIFELSRMVSEKITESKKYHIILVIIFSTVLITTTATLASIIGGNTKIETNSDDE